MSFYIDAYWEAVMCLRLRVYGSVHLLEHLYGFVSTYMALFPWWCSLQCVYIHTHMQYIRTYTYVCTWINILAKVYFVCVYVAVLYLPYQWTPIHKYTRWYHDCLYNIHSVRISICMYMYKLCSFKGYMFAYENIHSTCEVKCYGILCV